MNYKGHSNGGIISAIIVGVLTFTLTRSFYDMLIYSFITYMFSLYPDVDIKSTSLRIWLFLAVPVSMLLFYINDVYRGAAILSMVLVPQLFKHRGMAHTLKFGVLGSSVCLYVVDGYYNIDPIFFITSAMIGFTTHLILDKHIKL